MKSLFAITLLIFAPKQLSANDFTLNQLVTQCDAELTTAACTGYIFGVVEGFEVANLLNEILHNDAGHAIRICIPDHEPDKRVVEKVVKFAKSDPDRMDVKASSAIVAILASFYRCG